MTPKIGAIDYQHICSAKGCFLSESLIRLKKIFQITILVNWFLHWKYLQCTPCLCEAWTSNSSLSHSMKCPPRHLIYHDLHDCPHKLSLFANVAYYVARTTRLNLFKKVCSFYSEIWIIRKLLHFFFDKLFLVYGKIDKGSLFLWGQLTQVIIKYCNCNIEI